MTMMSIIRTTVVLLINIKLFVYYFSAKVHKALYATK